MKKNHPYGRTHVRSPLTKLLKIMKLTTFLLIIGALSVRAGGFSQSVKVNLSLNRVKLTTFFKVIERETDYRFTYCNDILPLDQTITVKARKKPLNEVMNEVISSLSSLSYRFDEVSGIIIISQKNNGADKMAFEPPLRKIEGKV